MKAYYNEIDRYCCDWLSNLMDAGHITPGTIDDRSIADVSPDDVKGFERVHWFAGIAGWDHALDLAGWGPRPVWTGSCPCQPFSAAGKGGGGQDDRHLWPHWRRLIGECKPDIIFGEQVAAAVGWGWLDAVLGDLEAEGYATGAAVLGAHSVGAPHIRQRVWFVANADGGIEPQERPSDEVLSRGRRVEPSWPGATGGDGFLADAGINGPEDGWIGREQLETQSTGDKWNEVERSRCSSWSDLVWLPCSDGKARPTQPGLFPLAHRTAGRVGRLRAYGNCIVPQVAAQFIAAVMEARP